MSNTVYAHLNHSLLQHYTIAAAAASSIMMMPFTRIHKFMHSSHVIPIWSIAPGPSLDLCFVIRGQVAQGPAVMHHILYMVRSVIKPLKKCIWQHFSLSPNLCITIPFCLFLVAMHTALTTTTPAMITHRKQPSQHQHDGVEQTRRKPHPIGRYVQHAQPLRPDCPHTLHAHTTCKMRSSMCSRCRVSAVISCFVSPPMT